MFRHFALLLLLTSAASAQSRKPLFPLPSALQQPQTAASAELRATIAPELVRVAPSCKLSGGDKVFSAAFELKGEGSMTLVRVDDPCLCASGECPIFVVQKSKVVLHDASGFGYAVIPNPKGGTEELLIASHTSANFTSLQRYRWKGGKFKLQDCEAAVRKDDARSKSWNPEELEITTCDAIALK